MSNSINTQHPKLISGYLNSENNPAPGVPLASPSGSIVQAYYGMVGGRAYIDESTALALSNAAVGTLYAGAFQMVKFSATPVSYKRGQIVFWDLSVDESIFQITNDESAVPPGDYKAGIVINADTGQTGGIDPGNFGFIQIMGKASVKFRAVLSDAGAIGSPVWIAAAGAGADNATADVLPVGASVRVQDIPHILGVAEVAPVGGAISIVGLQPFMLRQ